MPPDERHSADFVRDGEWGYTYPPDTWTPAQLEVARARPPYWRRRPAPPADPTIDDGPTTCTLCGGTGQRIPNRGERNGSSKLTVVQVQAIRRRYAAGEPAYKLAELFGVSPDNITFIVRRKTWRHVP